MDDLVEAIGVGRRLGQPAVGQVERALDQGDRLADVMQRRREERLPQRLDPVGQGGQADRGGPVERIADEGDAGHGIAGLHLGRQLRGHRPADLLAQDPELRDDRDGTEALVEADLGVGDRRGRHRIVVEGRCRLLVGQVAPTQDVHHRVEQLRDVVGDRVVRSFGMERLAAGDAHPAIEDPCPLDDQGVGHRAHVGAPDDDVHAGIDVGRGAVAARRGGRLFGMVGVRHRREDTRDAKKPPSSGGFFALKRGRLAVVHGAAHVVAGVADLVGQALVAVGLAPGFLARCRPSCTRRRSTSSPALPRSLRISSPTFPTLSATLSSPSALRQASLVSCSPSR